MELFLDTANVDEIREGARIKTKVMAASIRHPLHCVLAARAAPIFRPCLLASSSR